MNRSTIVAILLAASAINLALMVPGGFVETRDFSAYSAGVLAAFNIFLTVLGLGSLVLAWLTTRRGIMRLWSGLAGVSFGAVYLLDLGQIFPVTPVPMSPLLTTLEWLGTAFAVLLLAALIGAKTGQGSAGTQGVSRPVIVLLGVIGIAIVIFATIAAMGG